MVWLVILIALLIPLVAVVLDSQVVRALASRIENQGRIDAADPALLRRVNHLETELDRLNGEVQRLEEETTFLHRLLENKPAPTPELPPGEQNR